MSFPNCHRYSQQALGTNHLSIVTTSNNRLILPEKAFDKLTCFGIVVNPLIMPISLTNDKTNYPKFFSLNKDYNKTQKYYTVNLYDYSTTLFVEKIVSKLYHISTLNIKKMMIKRL